MSGPTPAEFLLTTNLEHWAEIPDAPDYFVSNLGRVMRWTADGLRNCSQSRVKGGYLVVTVKTRRGWTTRYVHQAVLAAFRGRRRGREVARHLNGRQTDNWLPNLSWGSQSENVLDSVRQGTHGQSRKTRCRKGHAYSDANTYLNPAGARECRTCRSGRRVAA